MTPDNLVTNFHCVKTTLSFDRLIDCEWTMGHGSSRLMTQVSWLMAQGLLQRENVCEGTQACWLWAPRPFLLGHQPRDLLHDMRQEPGAMKHQNISKELKSLEIPRRLTKIRQSESPDAKRHHVLAGNTTAVPNTRT